MRAGIVAWLQIVKGHQALPFEHSINWNVRVGIIEGITVMWYITGDGVSHFICKTDRSQNMIPDEKRGYLNQYPGEEIAKRLEEIIKSVDKDLELDLDFDQGYTVS